MACGILWRQNGEWGTAYEVHIVSEGQSIVVSAAFFLYGGTRRLFVRNSVSQGCLSPDIDLLGSRAWRVDRMRVLAQKTVFFPDGGIDCTD